MSAGDAELGVAPASGTVVGEALEPGPHLLALRGGRPLPGDGRERVVAQIPRFVLLAGEGGLDDGSEAQILIDTHSRPVCPQVWALFDEALRRFGPRSTIIEWDAELPPLQALLSEAGRADARLLAWADDPGVHDARAA